MQNEESEGLRPRVSQPRNPDPIAVAALIAIVIGWFLLSALETRVADLRLTFHFYDMWSVLQHPSRLVTGLTDGDRPRGALFGATCLACIIAALFATLHADRPSRLILHLTPLALMIVCGLLLYREASADFLANASPPDSIVRHLTALANVLADRVGRNISRHVTLGLGAYLSFAASVVLAVRSASRYRILSSLPRPQH